MSDITGILITAFAISIILMAVLFVFRRNKSLTQKALELVIPEHIPHEGVDIPLIRAFTGILGVLTIADNSIFPEMRFFEDHMTYRVMLRKTAMYTAIKRVGGSSRKISSRLRFEFYDRPLSFIAILVNAEEYQMVEQFLKGKGVPVETRN